MTQLIEPEHLPEPPASPLSNTLPSTTSSPHEEAAIPTAPKADLKAGKSPSANRLSISYHSGNRRLVMDAEVVQSLKVFRKEGRIEIVVNVTKEKDDTLKGILVRNVIFSLRSLVLIVILQVEALSEVTKSYLPLPPVSNTPLESDATVPPFWNLTPPTTILLVVYLDTARPLSEPKWAKTGDIQDWLKSMFGRMFWVAGDAAEGWEKKIQVVDPDPVSLHGAQKLAHTDPIIVATDNLDCSRWLGHELSCGHAHRTPKVLEDTSDRSRQHLGNSSTSCSRRKSNCLLPVDSHYFGSKCLWASPLSPDTRVCSWLSANSCLAGCSRNVPNDTGICSKGLGRQR